MPIHILQATLESVTCAFMGVEGVGAHLGNYSVCAYGCWEVRGTLKVNRALFVLFIGVDIHVSLCIFRGRTH